MVDDPDDSGSDETLRQNRGTLQGVKPVRARTDPAVANTESGESAPTLSATTVPSRRDTAAVSSDASRKQRDQGV